ncbi:cation:proton antiporter [Lacticaseibacillus songhuajiangensis]|uniref:cation:proton antiporter n=1 Tax=Lacticaseibacillus songhuajiangensis TaxID=1296539 RepID=UPI000F793586|nr:sodium:proton antiporter [Lacticaseibacillus songhuajiangensis]
MALIQGAILLVSIVLLGNVIGHFIPMVPDALIQIVLGLLLALVVHINVPVDTDWFMLLFIAPLLYNDGRHFPRRALWALRGQIVSNAVFLVFATMFLGGFLIHALVPQISFAAAVALAALLAPTDPIAVEGIAKRVRMPKRVLHLVAGESLINDASGLIGFKYGIAAALSGTFIIKDAAADFFYVAVVGAIAGAGLMMLINAIRKLLLSQGIGDTIVHTVLQLVTPFIIYLFADELVHASGVIAVVIAGLMSNSKNNAYMTALPRLKLVSSHAWDILVYVLNGLIFILLGIELPVAMRGTIHDTKVGTWSALMYVVIIYVVLIGLRFVWVYVNDLISQRQHHVHKPRVVSAMLTAVAGARGAITVVGVLGVPTVTLAGNLFPQRSLMLFIAAGVTVLSLVVASVTLPLLVRLLPNAKTEVKNGENTHLTLVQAEDYLLRSAMTQVKTAQKESLQKPALDLIGELQQQSRRLQLSSVSGDVVMAPMLRDELEIKKMGTQGELEAVQKLRADGKISTRLFDKLSRRYRSKLTDLDYMLAHAGKRTWRMRWQQLHGRIRHRVEFLQILGRPERGDEYRFVAKVTAKGALANINATLKSPAYKHRKFNKQVISTQIVHYRNRIATVKSFGSGKRRVYEAEMQRLRMIAYAAQRSAVHELMEQSYITPITAQRLSADISYSENAVSLRAADSDAEI